MKNYVVVAFLKYKYNLLLMRIFRNRKLTLNPFKLLTSILFNYTYNLFFKLCFIVICKLFQGTKGGRIFN